MRLIVDSTAGTLEVHNYWRNRTLRAKAISKVSWNVYKVQTQDTRYSWDSSLYNCLFISHASPDGKAHRPIRVYATIGKVKDLSTEHAISQFCTANSIPYDASEPDEVPVRAAGPLDFGVGPASASGAEAGTDPPWWSEPTPGASRASEPTPATTLTGGSTAGLASRPVPQSAPAGAAAPWADTVGGSFVTLAPNKSAVRKDLAGGNAFFAVLVGGVVWLPIALIFHSPGSSSPAPIALPVGLVAGAGFFAFATWRVSTIRLDIDAPHKSLVVHNLFKTYRIPSSMITEAGSLPYRRGTRNTPDRDTCVYLKLRNEHTVLDIQASNSPVDDSVIHAAIAEFCRANAIPVTYEPST